jgi:hypothetical protein
MSENIKQQLSLAKDELTRVNNLRRILKYTMDKQRYRVILNSHKDFPIDMMGIEIWDFIDIYDSDMPKICRGFSTKGVILEDAEDQVLTDYSLLNISAIVRINNFYGTWDVVEVLYRSDDGKTTFVIPEIVEELRLDKVNDISKKIVGKLVELGIVRDFTDKDDSQDSIREILKEYIE